MPDQPAKNIAVILLSYNTRQVTLKTLSFFANELNRWGAQLIVVDNASSDGSADAIAQKYPFIDLVRCQQNLGFSAGNNRGLARSDRDLIFLLNSDIIIYPKDFLALVQIMEQELEVGILSPGLRTQEGLPQAYAYGSDPSLTYLLKRGGQQLLKGQPLHDWDIQTPLLVDWVSGACLLIRRAVLTQIGGLDEKLFMYFEDNDWCLRARKAGWKVMYWPKITIVHLGGQSQSNLARQNEIYQRSLVYFFQKHKGRVSAATLRLALVAYNLLVKFKMFFQQ